MMDFELDLTDVKVTDFEPIPDGSYTVEVVNSESASTKSGGVMIKVELAITSEHCQGRKVFTNFNVQNSNPKAVEIGLQQLKSMILASGSTMLTIKDPSALIGLKFEVYLLTEEDGLYKNTQVKKFGKAGVELAYKARVKKEEPVKAFVDSSDIPF